MLHDVIENDFEDFEVCLAEIESSVEYAEEQLVADAQALIIAEMHKKNISKADLARLLDVSKPRVTQMLSDDCKNFTLKLFARTCFALDVPVKVVRSDEIMARKTDMGWCIGDPWNEAVWHTSSHANQNEKRFVKHLAQSDEAITPNRVDLDEVALLNLMTQAVNQPKKLSA